MAGVANMLHMESNTLNQLCVPKVNVMLLFLRLGFHTFYKVFDEFLQEYVTILELIPRSLNKTLWDVTQEKSIKLWTNPK